MKDSAYCSVHSDQALRKDHAVSGGFWGTVVGGVIGGLPGALVAGLAGNAIGKKVGKEVMQKCKVFISFDFDHDADIKRCLLNQARLVDSPFEIHDWSVKEHLTGDWKEKVRSKLRRVDQVLVLCGENTHTAVGVSAELTIAQEEGVPYFLLRGRSGKTCRKPKAARSNDRIHDWTWENLKDLIG